MKKLLMTLLLTFCIGCTYTLLNKKDTMVSAKSTKETIMIDAGHGGYEELKVTMVIMKKTSI